MSASGQETSSSSASEFNAISFVVQQLMNGQATAALVQVMKATNAGDISPVGRVNVKPMVNQLTGDNIGVEHQVIYDVPYFRVQGGANAIILDPQVGDIGVAVFCSRDISTVKDTKAVANPASRRAFSWSDGLYFGGFLNGTPTQYVAFAEGGITIVSPTKITLQAPEIDLNASTKIVATSPEVDVNASTKVIVTSPDTEFTASTKFQVTSPAISLLGDTTIAGAISQTAGGSGGSATIIGPVTVTNDLTAAGKSVSTHTHTDPQGGVTSAPI